MKFQHTQTIAYMLLSASTVFVQANNRDRFNYGNTDEDDKDYGPEDWNEVSCDDPGNCVSSTMKDYIYSSNQKSCNDLTSFGTLFSLSNRRDSLIPGRLLLDGTWKTLMQHARFAWTMTLITTTASGALQMRSLVDSIVSHQLISTAIVVSGSIQTRRSVLIGIL